MPTPFEMMQASAQDSLMSTRTQIYALDHLSEYLNGLMTSCNLSDKACQLLNELEQKLDILPSLNELPEEEVLKLHEALKAYEKKAIPETQKAEFQLLVQWVEAHHFTRFVKE